MDLRTQTNTLHMVRQLMKPEHATQPCIATFPQKPEWPGTGRSAPLPKSTPQALGLCAERIDSFFDALAADGSLDPHSVIIIKDGHVAARRDFGAYDSGVWHITHSQCKSLTALAIGMLMDDGRILPDDKIVKLLEGAVSKLAAVTHGNLTVEHLLTMSSGILFNEAGSVTETDWLKCYFESAELFVPGKKFLYNSMNTYVLSVIVREVSGKSLGDFLQERLFAPLGIADWFWEKCPRGIEKGGWGLYICPEDMGKIGQLVMDGGVWQGRRLISRGFLDRATAARMKTPKHLGGYDYGYQIWVGRQNDAFLFNGMFGQNVLGYRDSGVIIAATAGNEELFQQSSFYSIADEHFAHGAALSGARGIGRTADSVRRGIKAAAEAGGDILRGIFAQSGRQDAKRMASSLAGRRYDISDRCAESVGVLPLYAQILQNNYSRGLRYIGFGEAGGGLSVIFGEEDGSYEFAVGTDDAKRTQISYRGEPYLVAVRGRFTSDEEDTPVLILRLSFLEISNSRVIKIFFYDDRLVLKLSEIPGEKYLLFAMATLRDEAGSKLLSTLVSRADEGFIRRRVHNSLYPELTARPQ